jgi:SSS family solute:Na+ symporter
MGQIVTVVGAILAVVVSIGLGMVKSLDLFSLFQALIAFLAPAMAAVFLAGVLWKRATAKAALTTLIAGTIVSVLIGICYLATWPSKTFWPPFLLLAFYIFVGLCVLMVVISLFTFKPGMESRLPTLRSTYASVENHNERTVWLWWAVLAVIMVAIYIFFN